MGIATICVGFGTGFEVVARVEHDGDDGDLGDARDPNVGDKGGGDLGLVCPCRPPTPPRICGDG